MEDDRMLDLKLLFFGIIIGIFAGLFSAFYRFVIHSIEHLTEHLIEFYSSNYIYLFLFLFFAIIISIVVGYIKKFESLCGGSGIPQVEAEIEGEISANPVRVLFSKIVGGSLSALCGLSVGREGPSIQIGAMVGKFISKLLKQDIQTEKFLLTCGASAGLSSAFNAPVSGVLFAVEEVHRHVNRKLLITAMAAAVSADTVSKILYGTNTVFNFNLTRRLPLTSYWLLIIFGIILAVLGVIYIITMKLLMNFNDRLKIRQEFKFILYFIVPVVLLFTFPYVLGGGGILMAEIQKDLPIKMLLLMFVIKLVFSCFSFSSGIPGGIFFPILVLGATIGAIFGKIVDPMYINSFIVLGMAGYLTAVVRAPITASILIFEMTGNLSYFLPISIICLITYVIPDYLKAEPIYEYLLERLLGKKNENFNF